MANVVYPEALNQWGEQPADQCAFPPLLQQLRPKGKLISAVTVRLSLDLVFGLSSKEPGLSPLTFSDVIV